MTQTLFSGLPLTPEIQTAISEMGFIQASQIQAETIPLLLEGKDVIGQAQTGTGKTAAFGIPLLEKIAEDEKHVSSLVMCPTRELAIQVASELRKIAKYKKHIHILPVYGGEPIYNQIKELKRHNQVIVGTPGRIMDHLERKTLSFDRISTVVLDEADEMLNMGFRDDIESILSTMPKERQTVLFSATMPKPIIEIAKKFQHHPAHVKVTKENLTAASIEQVYFDIGRLSKTKIISTLIQLHDLKLAIIFCNTKRMVDEVVKTMKASGMRAEGIHGDFTQQERNKVLTAFREGRLNILVATDVAARGIDVNDIDAVINYDIPMDPEYYVHRIGRTGRAGKTGKSFTFITGRNEARLLKGIEYFAKIRIERRELPTEQEIRDVAAQRLLKRIKSIIAHGKLEAFDQIISRFVEEGIPIEHIASSLLKMSFPSETVQHHQAEPKDEGRREYSDRGRGNDREDRFRSRRSEGSGDHRREQRDDRHRENRTGFAGKRDDKRNDRPFVKRDDTGRNESRPAHAGGGDEQRDHRHREPSRVQEGGGRFERRDGRSKEKQFDRPEPRFEKKETHDVKKRFVKRKLRKPA
jgi:ATP-dependent RNA helicase DeaD